MQFEFDPGKSATNLDKHGIDFETAQLLWADDRLLIVPALRTDEVRFLAIGKIDVRHWSAVMTYRSERIRIISVRRSREKEISFHEGG